MRSHGALGVITLKRGSFKENNKMCGAHGVDLAVGNLLFSLTLKRGTVLSRGDHTPTISGSFPWLPPFGVLTTIFSALASIWDVAYLFALGLLVFRCCPFQPGNSGGVVFLHCHATSERRALLFSSCPFQASNKLDVGWFYFLFHLNQQKEGLVWFYSMFHFNPQHVFRVPLHCPFQPLGLSIDSNRHPASVLELLKTSL